MNKMVRSPILESPTRVEQRAGRIMDPVERLRFLRQEMHSQPEPVYRRRRTGLRHAASLMAGLVVLVVIGLMPTGTAETFAKERRLVVAAAPVANPTPRVWLVEHRIRWKAYSNGLRIDLTFAVSNRPRRPFPIFPPGGRRRAKSRRQHASRDRVSHHGKQSAPFEEEEKPPLANLWPQPDRGSSARPVLSLRDRSLRPRLPGGSGERCGESRGRIDLGRMARSVC